MYNFSNTIVKLQLTLSVSHCSEVTGSVVYVMDLESVARYDKVQESPQLFFPIS